MGHAAKPNPLKLGIPTPKTNTKPNSKFKASAKREE
jgi:hypothetical protein